MFTNLNYSYYIIRYLSYHLQGISIPSFLKIQQVSSDIPFDILGGSLLLTGIHILRALAGIN